MRLMLALLVAATIPATFTITDVNIVDVRAGRIKAHQNVVIEDRTIREIGPMVKPTGTIISGTGKFLMPGLWDMHVHGTATPRFAEAFLANGVVGVRDMFGPMAQIKSLRGRQSPAPEIIAAGKILDGPKPIWPGSFAIATPEEGIKAVNDAIAEGSDFIKVYSLLSRESYFAIAEEARLRKVVFAGHVPNTVTVLEASNAGQKSQEHLYGILKACSSQEAELSGPNQLSRKQLIEALIKTYDPKKASAVFATFKKNQTYQCPTLVVLRSIAKLKDPGFTDDPRLKYVSPIYKAIWNPDNDRRFKTWTPADWAAAKISFDRNLKLVNDMQRAGVPIIAGTDVSNPYVFPGFSLHDELALYVEAGLSAAETLRTATINAAKYLGREREFGTIEPKKLAHLVLLQKNPLVDIRNTTTIEAVFLAGSYFDRKKLDNLLRQAESK